MAGMKRSRLWGPTGAAGCIVLLTLLSACGRREPVTGLFGYPWGTSINKVLADSADIEVRYSEPGFALLREPGRVYLLHVQYGLGFGDVRLDFDESGALWHGMVRVSADANQADSIRDQWHKTFGRETGDHRIETDSGYTTFWATGATVDRHFYSPTAPALDPTRVRALEIFHGGCLTGCPLYSVRLLPDGRALYLGVREVDPLGGYTGTWPSDRWNELAARAVSVDVRTLEPEFRPTSERGEARRGLATVLTGGERQTFTSVNESAPPALESLLAALDSVAGSVVWEEPVFTWDTLDIRAVGWLDLDSLEHLAAPR